MTLQARTVPVSVIALIGVAGLGSVVLAQSVKTDFNPKANFAAYKTYYWEKANPVQGNDLVNQRIVAAVDHWLTTKGWTIAPPERADLAVAANVATQQSQTLNTFYSGSAWGYGGWGGGGITTTTVNTFTEGSMVIDLFDRASKQLVWRGTATATVSDDPKKNAKTIQKAVEKMFKNKFPPNVPTKT